ncbi:MAG: homoserine dehydrogenase [Thermoanaerobaculia bacterium]
MSQISILRFDGSEPDLPSAVHEIYREWRRGRRVLAVVSASGCTADDLLKRAQQLGLPPQREGLAALLTLALDRSGIPATLLDPNQTGPITDGDPLDLPGIQDELARAIVVIPGRSACPGRPAPPAPARPPLRVALLGCGTVGGGALARILAQPAFFCVTGVAVRDLDRIRVPAVPRGLLTDDPAGLVEGEADVVVELLGGREPARSLIARALDRGRHVVTANKALLAEEVEALSGLAARRGVSLRFSAAVGGALPALETVRRAAASGRVRGVAGVLNGTCNFVLDRCAAGSSFPEAVALARDAGYAEADPTLDLDGSDAAQKLALLAREAFGEAVPWESIPRRGIAGLDESALAEAVRKGKRVRLVASCERTEGGLRASVQPFELPPDHPFAETAGAENALLVQLEGGDRIRIAARGAGRWPTTEAVLADLHDLAVETAEIEEVVA